MNQSFDRVVEYIKSLEQRIEKLEYDKRISNPDRASLPSGSPLETRSTQEFQMVWVSSVNYNANTFEFVRLQPAYWEDRDEKWVFPDTRLPTQTGVVSQKHVLPNVGDMVSVCRIGTAKTGSVTLGSPVFALAPPGGVAFPIRVLEYAGHFAPPDGRNSEFSRASSVHGPQLYVVAAYTEGLLETAVTYTRTMYALQLDIARTDRIPADVVAGAFVGPVTQGKFTQYGDNDGTFVTSIFTASVSTYFQIPIWIDVRDSSFITV